ncbi:MAG: hypothetical protein K6F58_02990 [Bacteroidales bacterium]|nr:hypothetical protein [Bacteroidales bacterium]
MKKELYIAAAALLVLCSCSKEGNSGALELRLSLPSPASKVALGDRDGDIFPAVWQEGDVVSLNGALSNPMSAGLAGSPDAAFSFDGFSGSSPYNLLYPGSSTGVVTLDGKTIPMYASGNSLEEVFTMHHLSCGICIPLTGDLSVASLTLSAPGNEAVAGSFTPSFSTGALSAASANPSLTVAYEPSVALSETPVCFYLFFAPGTFSEGLMLQAQHVADGVVREWRFATGSTLVKGKVYILPETSFSSRDMANGCPLSLEEMSEDNISIVL